MVVRRIALLSVAAILVACGGVQQPSVSPGHSASPAPARSPAPVSTPVTVVLGDADCRYLGAPGVPEGEIAFRLVNETTARFVLNVWRLNDGHAYQELAAHIAEEQRRSENNEPGLGHPNFATLAAEGVAAEEKGSLSKELVAGTYGFACIPNVNDQPVDIWAAGPMTVGAEACDAAAPPTPRARGYHDMTPLTAELGVLLSGGESGSPPIGGDALRDTWRFTAEGGWTNLIRCPAPPWGDVAYDAGSQRVLLRGGLLEGFAEVRETWSIDPASGEATLVSENEGAFGFSVYDAESDRVIGFDSTGRTWAYDLDAETWTDTEPEVSPPRRDWHAVAYDAESDRVILFGGVGPTDHAGVGLADTWAYDFNTNTWTDMAPAVAPPARFYSFMIYEPSSDRVILFGGVRGAFLEEEPFADSWAYDFNTNTWTDLNPSPAPSARGWHAMAFDASSGQVVLFGGGPDRDRPTPGSTTRPSPAGAEPTSQPAGQECDCDGRRGPGSDPRGAGGGRRRVDGACRGLPPPGG